MVSQSVSCTNDRRPRLPVMQLGLGIAVFGLVAGFWQPVFLMPSGVSSSPSGFLAPPMAANLVSSVDASTNARASVVLKASTAEKPFSIAFVGIGVTALACSLYMRGSGVATGQHQSAVKHRMKKVQRQFFPGLGGGSPPPSPLQQKRKSPARLIVNGNTDVRFKDVAGCDRAKEELVEVVDFLRNSKKYTDMGAKLPKGALLCGPPGTGKTMLAKAVAGEAQVPFYSISASEFVEVYAGVGASRVRDLFEQAKTSAPCIIFIDEIDAVGRQRSAGFGQGNDEREQTVNQLLTEMDGFTVNNGIVVIAATNRADVLDHALLRPGRFDRHIQVDPPDLEGRQEILKVHAKTRSLAADVDLHLLARQTPGMTGADLQNVLNEGAISAARSNKLKISSEDISSALDRINIGIEKKNTVMTERKKKLVAYHEAGHAIIGALMDDFDVVSKISIVPRGPTGGVTVFTPSEERLNAGIMTRQFLENRICVALGGRMAEELINGKDNVTTGASNDFQQCTQVATMMVTQFGMSEAVKHRFIGSSGGAGPFMGRDLFGKGAPPVSQKLKHLVDKETKRIVEEQFERGMYLLKQNRGLLDALADRLIEKERIDGEELIELIGEFVSTGRVVKDNKLDLASYGLRL